MSSFRLLLLPALILIAACSTPAAAPESEPETEPETEPDTATEFEFITNERLLATVPANFVRIYQINTETTRVSEFVPTNESVENWTSKLSFEAVKADTVPVDPITLLLSEAKADESRCEFVRHFNIHSGYENGYESSARLFFCGENAFTKNGEIKLMKVIRGNDYLYSINIVRIIEPFDVNKSNIDDQEVAVWSNYLGKISLCDDTDIHPCPAPTAP